MSKHHIDVVYIETSEGLVEALEDVFAVGVGGEVGVGLADGPDLGGDYEVLAVDVAGF